MKKPCPDCGFQMPDISDECPRCACWVDDESALYVRASLLLVYVLAFVWVLMVLNHEQEPAHPPTDADAPAIVPGSEPRVRGE